MLDAAGVEQGGDPRAPGLLLGAEPGGQGLVLAQEGGHLLIISVINSYYYGGVEQILKDRVNLSAEFLNKTANYSSAEEKSNIMFSSSMTSYENKFLVQFISVDKNLIIDSNGFTDNMEINTPDVNAALENKIELYRGKNAF